ncbi:MAG: toll/interleukin-1 receptor domain-containing protein [Pseudomonadota bacterium]
MAFDVFLAYAQDDRDMASLVARRLRALKFKVRFNRKEEEPTFDEKDARDAMKSQSMLVLWSEAALKSDWVRAAASIGHSRPGMLVQTSLDETIPYEPFRNDNRFDLSGFTSRTTVEGWYQTVDELGRRDGRKDLRAWIDIPTKDEDAKTDWLDAHPADPLALHAQALREKKLGIKPAPAAEAAGAAALAATAIGQGRPASATPTTTTLATTGTPAKAAALATENEEDGGLLIPMILAGIAFMLFLAWYRSSDMVTPAPAIANANLGQFTQTCPAGTVPGNLIAPPTLEAGPIINDTED